MKDRERTDFIREIRSIPLLMVEFLRGIIWKLCGEQSPNFHIYVTGWSFIYISCENLSNCWQDVSYNPLRITLELKNCQSWRNTLHNHWLCFLVILILTWHLVKLSHGGTLFHICKLMICTIGEMRNSHYPHSADHEFTKGKASPLSQFDQMSDYCILQCCFFKIILIEWYFQSLNFFMLAALCLWYIIERNMLRNQNNVYNSQRKSVL